MEIEIRKLGLSEAFWPNSADGVVLLATQMAENFFSRPNLSASPSPVIAMVKRDEDGQLARHFMAPVEPETCTSHEWNAAFFGLVADSEVLGGIQSFVGRIKVSADDPMPAPEDESLIQLLYARGRGLIQIRTTPFARIDGRATPIMATVVTDLEDLVEGKGEVE